jgi:MFS family permease
MFILSLSILQTEVPKEKYTLANGVLASLYFAGSSIGLVLGGSIVHYTDWRITFFPCTSLGNSLFDYHQISEGSRGQTKHRSK